MKSLEFIPVAEISTVVSKEGDLGLVVFPGFAASFSEFDFVFIDVFGGKRKFIIENFEVSNKGASVKFSNFDSADDVRFLCGKKIFILKSMLAGITKEDFFISDLIGCSVFFKDKFFGLVTNVEKYPGNDVISIKKENGSEVLLPLVDEYFGNVDIDSKRIDLIKEIEFEDDED